MGINRQVRSPALPVRAVGRAPGLERDAVVAVALQLLDEAGFSGLTLRRLADRLKVKAAALYWHFENKQDLIDALAERIMLAEFEHVKPDSTGWRDLLTMVAFTHRRALKRYRDGAQVLAHANMGRKSMLSGMERLLKELQSQGFTPQQSLVSFFAVVRFTIGCVFEEQTDPQSVRPPSAQERKEYFRMLEAEHPIIAGAWTAAACGKSPDYLFQQGLALILDGIAAQREHV